MFAVIEPGAPAHADDFERLFGTPTGTDLSALCAAHGIPWRQVADADALRAALGRTPEGIEVVEVTLDRVNRRNLDQRLRTAVGMALAPER
jgi:2-succinyl-5-enolpyruvyl-6-hydroxy-3-cyclohexene-1-carboxylate synthase